MTMRPTAPPVDDVDELPAAEPVVDPALLVAVEADDPVPVTDACEGEVRTPLELLDTAGTEVLTLPDVEAEPVALPYN